jgi:hypothetical protein
MTRTVSGRYRGNSCRPGFEVGLRIDVDDPPGPHQISADVFEATTDAKTHLGSLLPVVGASNAGSVPTSKLQPDDITTLEFANHPSEVVSLIRYLGQAGSSVFVRLYMDDRLRHWLTTPANAIVDHFSLGGKDATQGETIVNVNLTAAIVRCRSMPVSICESAPPSAVTPSSQQPQPQMVLLSQSPVAVSPGEDDRWTCKYPRWGSDRPPCGSQHVDEGHQAMHAAYVPCGRWMAANAGPPARSAGQGRAPDQHMWGRPCGAFKVASVDRRRRSGVAEHTRRTATQMVTVAEGACS